MELAVSNVIVSFLLWPGHIHLVFPLEAFMDQSLSVPNGIPFSLS